MKRINVQYFAILREQSGRSAETLDTVAGTPGDLYAELASRYSFTLPPSLVRASLNLELVPWDSILNDGDSVVFLPPVAGG